MSAGDELPPLQQLARHTATLTAPQLDGAIARARLAVRNAPSSGPLARRRADAELELQRLVALRELCGILWRMEPGMRIRSCIDALARAMRHA